MKILSATQIHEADATTIREEGIASAELMERAATAFCSWFQNQFGPQREVKIICGPGNNGGDGLAIARLLYEENYLVEVFVVGEPEKLSKDAKQNRKRLPQEVPCHQVGQEAGLIKFSPGQLVIDGLFGTGLSRPVEGLFGDVIRHLNESGATVVSIDVPSGLFTDSPTPAGSAIVQARHTVGFELPKLAYLLPQNHDFVGEWHVVPIGLSQRFIDATRTQAYYVTEETARTLLKPRQKFTHKGTFGHALLIGGSHGKMGAITLSAKACLRSGSGLLTLLVPEVGYAILQTAVPEAMTLTDPNRTHLTQIPNLDAYDVIGVGPGLGMADETRAALADLVRQAKAPLVFDADALNILSENKDLLAEVPADAVFTPHPKEFERLVGKAENEFHRLKLLRDFCDRYQAYVVLKGSHTCLGTPSGDLYFNSTGNAGMATGGTGDVLTGILTALVGQQYSVREACILGVYLHGLAGDLARKKLGEEALIASDVVEHLGAAFLQLRKEQHQ